jgi:hypothetical protein
MYFSCSFFFCENIEEGGGGRGVKNENLKIINKIENNRKKKIEEIFLKNDAILFKINEIVSPIHNKNLFFYYCTVL